MTREGRIIFIIKTHYISQYHISIWFDLTLSRFCDRCIVLLNNEHDILDVLDQLIPEPMKVDVIPFKAVDFSRIHLPIVPRVPLWRNSWTNGDYGVYLVRTLIPDLEADDWLVQIDQDIISSAPWSTVLSRIPLNEIDFFSRSVSKMDATWKHYPAAEAFFEETDVGMTLFGLQGYRVRLVDYLYEKRRRMAEIIEKKLSDNNQDLHNLTFEQSRRLWPLCEAHVGTEILRSDFRFLNLEDLFEDSFKYYSLDITNINFERFKNEGPDSLFFFHPIKDFTEKLLPDFGRLQPLKTCVEESTEQASRKGFVRWVSLKKIFIHPNKNQSSPKSTMKLRLRRMNREKSVSSLIGVVKLFDKARVKVIFNCDFIKDDGSVSRIANIEIAPGIEIPFCFKIEPEVESIVMSSVSSSTKTADWCHLTVDNLFIWSPRSE